MKKITISLEYDDGNLGPEWLNISADSSGNKLPEPSKDKILALIEGLSKFTEVKNKFNLRRLLK